jgi:hypothetical protein
MRIFHRASREAARAIVAGGFRDSTLRYGAGYTFKGVWMSSRPTHETEGGRGDVILSIDLPEELFREFEWVEVEPTLMREALIPAARLNEYGPAVLEEREQE